ncbi:uracil-DNA glycosylase [Bacillus paranthracis]|uniref:Uracil-DNA glycosylase n=4 Tax=Bacillus cereus group TaxID=86661 RepID=UNG_BACC7|nr:MULTISPECIES: uracil-DNA glycosylase [Bacillus]B7HYF9.1 RecName: Full=Uracil-DNA glycosylase; Short=UDG [Bacillus cereus AH187]B9IS32.1 RecName: Full=Uracil-DNA glycosylase; Short=UDG [Bacillus cereus Q1]ADY24606.1 uracil-DNA glycosylase [Bacillus thuringiensis serovar finitimus YBT-020]AFQ09580.1 uracil-DNA glycosylase [Bacillus cereus FRI-35]EDZ57397.1 uracil-DNA glycosylase [Bacillus cereus H3081.97]EEK97736.1 Uracil-DNA glycosylase [Bacillus cereus BDRD-ST26]EJP89397.1 uracil-DNA glyc
MENVLKNDWGPLLAPEFEKEYYRKLADFLKEEYSTHVVYPKKEDIFNALEYTSYENTKVVILGQDPYHGPNQAHGLSFSVQPGIKTPPSLLNMYKELRDEYGYDIPNNGYLVKWAEQGVLLLNTVLTVRQGEANSHKGKGWEHFTDRVIELLNEREKPVIFILWGRHAQAKKKLITNTKHHIIESVHPSPLSARRGFFGSKPYSKVNTILANMGEREIDWEIPNL